MSCLHRLAVAGAVVAAVAAVPAAASERTGLSFASASVEAEYSQAVPLQLLFVDKDGDPLDGTTACGASSCKVEVEIRIADNSGPAFDVTAPDVAVNAAGIASVRLTLVDGRHGGAVFVADDDGVDYTVTARFRGIGAFPLPVPDNNDADCADGAAGTDDGRLCPATATSTVKVFPEVPSLTFNQDVVMEIGDSVVLAASLEDSNGDADAAGSDIDGPGPKVLQNLVVRFAYDANDDGNPNFLTERIGSEDVFTNALGVASLEFFADPAFAQAGVYDAGLHAEFPGDSHYTVARTSVKLTLEAGGPDPAQTIIELDPDHLTADAVSETTVRVRLVDEDGNLLGPEAPEHDVQVTTTLGLLIDQMERDVLDGTYTQQLRVQRKGGTATVKATVDGEDAGSVDLIIDGPQGCTCNGGGASASSALAFVLLALVRNRKKLRG